MKQNWCQEHSRLEPPFHAFGWPSKPVEALLSWVRHYRQLSTATFTRWALVYFPQIHFSHSVSYIRCFAWPYVSLHTVSLALFGRLRQWLTLLQTCHFHMALVNSSGLRSPYAQSHLPVLRDYLTTRGLQFASTFLVLHAPTDLEIENEACFFR